MSDYLGDKRKFTGEIKATAPTPQDWVDLVRENERLKENLALAESFMSDGEWVSYLEQCGEQNK